MTAGRLQASGLVCGYGLTPVLAGVDLRLDEAEFVGLLGANGVGKSTLLRALAGLSALQGGQVALMGRSLADCDARALARLRAYLPQHQALETGWRVDQAVAIGRAPHQWGWGVWPGAEDRRQVQRAMQQAGILDLQHRRMETLSGGQRQRVHLARALAQATPILMLDEPTAHLDLSHQLAFYDLVRSTVSTSGVMVLAVLHDLNLAAQFCDRLVVLGGTPARVMADGPPGQVLSRDLVAKAFGVDVQIRFHPDSGRPYLLPQAGRPDGVSRLPVAVRARGLIRWHVVCGGGSAAAPLRDLTAWGVDVRVGVVNALDSDEWLAEQLGVRCLTEAPFSPIGEETGQALAQALGTSDAVVVTEVAWGSGNVANLRLLLSRMRAPEPPALFLLGGETLSARDFTGGEAARLWEQLKGLGEPWPSWQALRTALEQQEP
ncbi:MAG: ABC transporter ATP-binding protein [Candidatus Sericytochromatia bacterium]|nr:ABC transporter ATP-binding protein [Candidatus Sericytochromatia bacterium]